MLKVEKVRQFEACTPAQTVGAFVGREAESKSRARAGIRKILTDESYKNVKTSQIFTVFMM